MHEPEQVAGVLTELHAAGIGLSIDDFGTGYSSLSHLKRFPFDSVKIDRSFIRHLPDDPDDSAITRAVIGMSHSLGMRVIAEGVETEPQRQFLQQAGCDLFQGYLVSPPLPAEGWRLGSARTARRRATASIFCPPAADRRTDHRGLPGWPYNRANDDPAPRKARVFRPSIPRSPPCLR
jgi:EAL domain-containing protein (putative c-di-GMP-specific phosphodiesterase class I)